MLSLPEATKKILAKLRKSSYVLDYKRLVKEAETLYAEQLVSALNLAWANVVTEECCESGGPDSERDQEANESLNEDEFKGTKDPIWSEFVKDHTAVIKSDHLEYPEERKCVQIPLSKEGLEIEYFLRKGVRCFLLDLFVGTSEENQQLLLNLRTLELKISREIGFPVRSTVIARINPREPFTGLLRDSITRCMLHAGDKIVLSSNRRFSRLSNEHYVYVNAGCLIPQLKMFDSIVISPGIKLTVQQVQQQDVECRVVHGGILQSRFPVFFPKRIDQGRISMEELEDINFCKEMDINLIYSYAAGNMSVLKDLKRSLTYLDYTQLKLGACVNVNACDGKTEDLDWLLENCDSFLLFLNPPAKPDNPEILSVPENMQEFLKGAHSLYKPLIMDGSEISAGHYVVEPKDCCLIYFQPDRYLLHRSNLAESIYFQQLQVLVFDPFPIKQMSQQDTIDAPIDKCLTLAREIAKVSLEKNIPLILVCSANGIIAQYISHFHSKSQIISIAPSSAQADYISLNWNIRKLSYNMDQPKVFNNLLYEKLLYGILFAEKCKLIKNKCLIILVFERKVGEEEYKNEFHLFQFDEKSFVKQLLTLMIDQ